MKSESTNEDLYVARIRGLPWSATKEEIADFFTDSELANDKEKSVIICKNRQGRPSGEAYIVFASQKDLDNGMAKDREKMGRRYIEVFTAKPVEVKWAASRDDSAIPSDDNVLRLRGLPWGSTNSEIVKFFEGIHINPDCILLTNDGMGRSSGEAYVQFNSEKEVKEAMKRNRGNMGSRYIEIFPSSMKEAFEEKLRGSMARGRPGPYDRPSGFGRGFSKNIKGSRNQFYKDGGMSMPQEMRNISGHLVRMRGLPFSATEMEIAEWFSAVADPIHVAIEYNNGGRPSGNAEVYFRSSSDAQKAMSKNKQNMQHRYVELFNEGMRYGGMGNGNQEPVGFDMESQVLMRGLQSMGMGGNRLSGGMGMTGMEFLGTKRNGSGIAMGEGGFNINQLRAAMLPNLNQQTFNSF